MLNHPRSSCRGNIVIALFGAVAAVGVLALGMQNLIKGPMTTMSKVTKVTMAENQMMAASQMAAVTATTQASSGDCDADGYVEPLEWVDATGDGPDGVAGSDGGGFLPLSIAAMKKDPWNTLYGYCVWDHGAAVDNAGCGGNTQKRLQGTNAEQWPSLAIISAGPDKVFQTQCHDWADANADNQPDDPLWEKATGSDDVVYAQTYGEASASVGGLWKLKSGDPATATISKDLEVTGGGAFSQSIAISAGGLLLPDQTASGACNAANSEQLRRNTGSSPSALEICSWDGVTGTWDQVSGGGGGGGEATSFNDDNTVVCDNTKIGQVRVNTTTDLPEYCDGIGWRPFAISVPAVNLIFDIPTINNMNVDGTCGTATCTGTTVDFTLTNTGSSTSASLVTALTNSTNFTIISDTCNGQTLDPNEACIVQVQPKATGNMPISGQLNVTGNNNPFVYMQGVASGFSCTPGRSGGGGTYVACGLNDGDGAYDLVIMPGGCDGTTTNPTCSGTDGVSVQKSWGVNGTLPGICDTGITTCKNAQGSQTLALLQSVGVGTFPANEYCQTMTYGGYTDWYLPSEAELQSRIYPAKAAGHLTGFAASTYWNSNMNGTNNSSTVNMSTGALTSGNRAVATIYTRCVRRHNLALPAAIYDSDPDAIAGYALVTETWPHRLVTEASGTRMNTAVYTPTGFNQMNVSITADGGNPQLSINGGAQTASGTMNVGQTIQFFLSAPTTVGTEYTATITLGTDTYTLKAAYADPSITLKMFVTNTATVANAAAGQCTTDATNAGLTGSTWSHFAGSGTAMRLSAPWNWGKLERIDGATIADDWEDLWDGSVDNAINVTAAGGTRNASVWTGSGSGNNGRVLGTVTGPAAHCSSWTNGAGVQTAYLGSSTTAGAGWLSSDATVACNAANIYAYCIQSTAGSDIDPNDVTFGRKVSYTSGTRTSSAVVTITGISSTVAVSVSGASGDPKIKINGGAEVASGTVGLNGTLQVVMDAPTVLGTEYEALVNIGSDNNISYKVGYADGSLIKRVFVTSSNFNMQLTNGRSAADSLCNTLAAPTGMGGTWKALLSTSTSPASTHIGWNWGELQRVDGVKVADDWDDLWDGTIDNPIKVTEAGVTIVATNVNTGTTPAGLTSTGCAAGAICTYNDWYTGGPGAASALYGNSDQAGAGWTANAVWNLSGIPVYCVEDTAGTTDTTPNAIEFPYKVQVATSSRQTSDPVTIAGLGPGVSVDVTFTATGGTAKYTVNGGAEQDSGTGTDVQNGDVLRLVMDAPATDNSFNKMTVQVGSLSNIIWRVWTGDSSGTVVKRVFITSATAMATTAGGVTAGDLTCQSRATTAGLTGTWKAILSGDNEVDWAINRVGYNWSTLKLVDNTTVVTTAGNLWKTATVPLTNPILKSEFGTSVGSVGMWTGTAADGSVYTIAGVKYSCTDWTQYSCSAQQGVTTATNGGWISLGLQSGGGGMSRIYCIEQ